MPSQSPARGVANNRIIVDFANDTDSSEMLFSMFNNSSIYNQDDIDGFASVLNLIYQINDLSGNKFGDAFDYNDDNGVKTYLHEGFRNTYKNLFIFTMMSYLFFFIRGVRCIEEITNGLVTIDSYENEEEKEHFRLSAQINYNPTRILMFFEEIFNRRNELLSYYENTDISRPIFTNMLMRILNPPPEGAPTPPILYGPQPTTQVLYNFSEASPSPEVVINNNPTATRLNSIRSDLDYLRSLGLTATSDNETMKRTLRDFKNITGSDYVFPGSSITPSTPLTPLLSRDR
jgi:hypothetical protein